jgi:hypothetical protein
MQSTSAPISLLGLVAFLLLVTLPPTASSDLPPLESLAKSSTVETATPSASGLQNQTLVEATKPVPLNFQNETIPFLTTLPGESTTLKRTRRGSYGNVEARYNVEHISHSVETSGLVQIRVLYNHYQKDQWCGITNVAGLVGKNFAKHCAALVPHFAQPISAVSFIAAFDLDICISKFFITIKDPKFLPPKAKVSTVEIPYQLVWWKAKEQEKLGMDYDKNLKCIWLNNLKHSYNSLHSLWVDAGIFTCSPGDNNCLKQHLIPKPRTIPWKQVYGDMRWE